VGANRFIAGSHAKNCVHSVRPERGGHAFCLELLRLATSRREFFVFLRRLVVVVSVVAVVVVAFAPSAFGEVPSPGQMPYEAGASNMGMCSAFLASLGVRDDVNHLIQQNPGLFDGVEHAGELYSVRAQQRVNQPPPLECLARR
jgi:hypothetical protein